mmetsp:Transcript_18139/g.58388  ORF Transcript_18139/g.58388 Transcript_18139/m.58388 type:complete len:330 (+) Transcript_18139:32-1021(+)
MRRARSEAMTQPLQVVIGRRDSFHGRVSGVLSDAFSRESASLVSPAFAGPSVFDDHGDAEPRRSRLSHASLSAQQVQTRASLNAALLGSAGAGVIIGLCSAAYSHAGPGKELSSYTHSLLPGIWSAYQGSVSAYPVVTKAALTGVTYVLGDMLAQAVELRHANREDGPAEERQLLAKASRRRGLLLQMDPSRYMRSGLIGLLLLGPLAHYYYAFVAAHLARWPLPCKIGLDQTLYLSLYNTVYYVSLGVLSCRPVRDVARVYQTQFWLLLTAAWRLWPLVGIVTYNFVPHEHRVLFVDAIEIAYSAILSTLTAKRSSETDDDDILAHHA